MDLVYKSSLWVCYRNNNQEVHYLETLLPLLLLTYFLGLIRVNVEGVITSSHIPDSTYETLISTYVHVGQKFPKLLQLPPR